MAQQVINIPWTTGTGNIVCKWDDADPSPTEVKISSTDVHQEQRSQVITFKSTDYDAEASLTVNQAATEITYILTPVLSSTSNIPASGGNVQIERCELQEFHNGDWVETSYVTPDSITGTADGFTVLENTITAANRGIVEGDVRSIQITCSYLTPRGITVQGTVTISQAANNRVTVYSKPNITDVSAADIPASGGTVSEANVSYSQSRHYYYDSGDTEELEPLTTGGTLNYGDPVTAVSLGTTIKNRTIVGTLTFIVSMNGQTSVEDSIGIYQEANAIVSSTEWEITVEQTGLGTSINPFPADSSYPEDNGTIKVHRRRTNTYTSNSTKVEENNEGCVWTKNEEANWLTIIGNPQSVQGVCYVYATGDNTETSLRTGIVTVTLGDYTNSWTIYQAAYELR